MAELTSLVEVSRFHLIHPRSPRLCGTTSHPPQCYISVWDLPSGTLLHTLECDGYHYEIQWSRTDQYLLFNPWDGNSRYLNTETFQEEVLEHPGDHFQRP